MSDVHSKELYGLVLSHFNEPMLSFGQLVRCVGYAETAVDCYIIVKGHNGKLSWNTCVGGYVFLDKLKNQNHVKAHNGEDWDDFTRLDSDLKCSGATKEPEFMLVLNHHDWEGHDPQ